MPAETLLHYLEEKDIDYEVLRHEKAYTAQEVAAAAHISGDAVAKAVMVIVDGEMGMAVLPASYRVNLDHLKEQLGAKQVRLATEKEFKDRFPDCDLGALPPFGNLYDIPIYADERLSEEIDLAFCGGSHTELIRISFEAFKRLAEPRIHKFAYHA
ncbi:MAG: YbaK/EbsC family protein [Anaerolineales bacterium]|jgi:Ala-tRNA(Pro) deacylase